MNSMLLADFYKLSHRKMYPPGTTKVYSTWTPRGSRMAGVSEFVWFGLQAFIQRRLLGTLQDDFFAKDVDAICSEYARVVRHTLGEAEPETQHIRDLHELGYLPLRIRGLDEGTVVPLRTPVMTIENTEPRFFWLTNYVETLMSSELWQPSTSATIAHQFRKLYDKYALETVGDTGFCQFQGHDFSMRGMGCLDAATLSGLGHLTSFVGTDTVPAILAAESFYGANVESELVGTSVPATEHSVQCCYGDDDKYVHEIITRIHPTGIVSVVSDGYDFWDVINRVLPLLKPEILAREGKLVVRPDSGDPVKIVCGDPEATTEWERKGAVERLWDIFGGTTSAQGYRCLDPHIGLIYGDAITYERATKMLAALKAKGFASTNVVHGIGSFTYQYTTRDTFNMALKSTLAVRDGKEIHIFKTPKTDDGMKYSQRGRVVVERNESGAVTWRDGLSLTDHVPTNLLLDRFVDGQVMNQTTFAEVRKRVASAI
jgi:nicotinamide phosphoribosyltransferase